MYAVPMCRSLNWSAKVSPRRRGSWGCRRISAGSQSSNLLQRLPSGVSFVTQSPIFCRITVEHDFRLLFLGGKFGAEVFDLGVPLIVQFSKIGDLGAEAGDLGPVSGVCQQNTSGLLNATKFGSVEAGDGSTESGDLGVKPIQFLAIVRTEIWQVAIVRHHPTPFPSHLLQAGSRARTSVPPPPVHCGRVRLHLR